MLSYLCRVPLVWKEVSDVAAGAYNVNITKLGANLISLMRSNQRAIRVMRCDGAAGVEPAT